MEYKLDLLQKRVNHLEDLILTINDKIGSVLDEFFTHRAHKSAEDKSICLSLITKLKSSFGIKEQNGSESGEAAATPESWLSSSPSPKPVTLVRTNTQAMTNGHRSSTGHTSCEEASPTTATTSATARKKRQRRIEVITIEDDGNEEYEEQKADANVKQPEDEDRKDSKALLHAKLQLQPKTASDENADPDLANEMPDGNNVESHQSESGDIDNSDQPNQPNSTDAEPAPEAPELPEPNEDSVEEEDDDDAITLSSDDEYGDAERLALICEPEVFIKVENDTEISMDISTDVDGNANANLPDQSLEETNESSVSVNDNTLEVTEPDPETAAEQDTQIVDGQVEEPDETGNLRSRTPASAYKQTRTFETLEEGKIYLKVNGMICGSNRDHLEGKKYRYSCKDKECKKLMYLLAYHDRGRSDTRPVALFEKYTVRHNHPPIIVKLPTPRASKSSGSSEVERPQFKLVQNFQTRADAVHVVQEQDPGAWLLNQVVECSEDVKAYYNCALVSGRTCPVTMILRTFKENGKVDQYIWQGKHVHDPEAADGKTFAHYYTPPSRIVTKKGQSAGRGYTCINTFATEEEAKTEISADNTASWEMRSSSDTIEGKKTYFFCKHRRCPRTMYLRVVTLTGKIYQYISDGEHEHSHGLHVKKNRGPRIPHRYPGPPRKRIVVHREYAQVATCASDDEAKGQLRNEMAWSMRSWRMSEGYKKIYYGCRHDSKCPVRCFIKVDPATGTATVHISTSDVHVHNQSPTKRKRRPTLPTELKKVFDGLYESGLNSVDKIVKEMERRGDPVPAYHVFEYVARMRRMKYGSARRGRGVKLAVKKKPVAGRVLSANPKNERKRQEKAAKVAAKLARAQAAANGNINDGPVNGNGTSSSSSSGNPIRRAPPIRRPIGRPPKTPPTSMPTLTKETSRPSTSTSTAAASTSDNANAIKNGEGPPVLEDKIEQPDRQGLTSPFRKMFRRQACIKLKRIEIIDLH